MRRLILIAERDRLVAWELGMHLEGRGFEVVGPFVTGTEAVRWLEAGGQPDAAILDSALRDGPSHPLARALSERGISLVVYGQPDGHWPLDLARIARVPRPSSFSRLLRALFDGPAGS